MRRFLVLSFGHEMILNWARMVTARTRAEVIEQMGGPDEPPNCTHVLTSGDVSKIVREIGRKEKR